MDVEAEDGVIAFAAVAIRVADPRAEEHLLPGAYLRVGGDRGYQSGHHGTVGVEAVAVGGTAVLLAHRPSASVHAVRDGVLAVVGEVRIDHTDVVGRGPCGIDIAVGGLVPREMPVVVLHISGAGDVEVEVLRRQDVVVLGYLLLGNQCLLSGTIEGVGCEDHIEAHQ